MADYSFTPQFANLTGLQPLQAIDVTRGGALQFQPLQAIEVASSRPELVGQSIAGAVQNIAQGALSGITAKYEEKKAAEREQLEHERKMELYGAKKRSENEDFYQKQRAAFIAENSQRIDFPEKLAAFDSAYSGILGRLPEIQPKAKKEQTSIAPVEIVEPELPTAEFVSDVSEISSQPSAVDLIKEQVPVTGFGASVADEKRKMALEGIGAPSAIEKPLEEISIPIPAISGIPQQPEDPAAPRNVPGEVKSKSLASQIAAQINKTSPISKVEVELNPSTGGYGFVQKDIETARQEAQAKAEAKTIEQQKLDIAKAEEARKKAESEQQMQIRQQKVKDENKTLADHVETAATSLRELDDIISTIQNNPWSVGKMSAIYSKLPIDTDAAKVRAKLETVGSNVAVNALTAMRQASPTGAAVGNTSDKEMSMFRATEGSFDPDNLQAKDILRVLREIKRKRLDVYNNSVNILKQNNPEYTPPEIKYPKETKQKGKAKSDEDMVSVVSPDGKSGRIPKSQLEQALTEGYKLKQ